MLTFGGVSPTSERFAGRNFSIADDPAATEFNSLESSEASDVYFRFGV
jgi:hypothetical protein